MSDTKDKWERKRGGGVLKEMVQIPIRNELSHQAHGVETQTQEANDIIMTELGHEESFHAEVLKSYYFNSRGNS